MKIRLFFAWDTKVFESSFPLEDGICCSLFNIRKDLIEKMTYGTYFLWILTFQNIFPWENFHAIKSQREEEISFPLDGFHIAGNIFSNLSSSSMNYLNLSRLPQEDGIYFVVPVFCLCRGKSLTIASTLLNYLRDYLSLWWWNFFQSQPRKRQKSSSESRSHPLKECGKLFFRELSIFSFHLLLNNTGYFPPICEPSMRGWRSIHPCVSC